MLVMSDHLIGEHAVVSILNLGCDNFGLTDLEAIARSPFVQSIMNLNLSGNEETNDLLKVQ